MLYPAPRPQLCREHTSVNYLVENSESVFSTPAPFALRKTPQVGKLQGPSTLTIFAEAILLLSTIGCIYSSPRTILAVICFTLASSSLLCTKESMVS